MNATLRDNILFGHKYNQEFYDRVIDACALTSDLEMLPSGDMTEIGEKGINLSGGQKARVSLARAVYSRADVYILDDPLAAVDAHVGKHLYSCVIGPTGMLKNKARILVTNAVQYLNTADNIYMLDRGRVVDYGSFAEVATREGRIFKFLKQGLNEFGSFLETSVQNLDQAATQPGADVDRQLNVSTAHTLGSTEAVTRDNVVPYRILKDEERATGWIGWDTIRFYMDACGKRNIGLLVCAVLISLIFNTATGLWIAHWADSNDMDKADKHGSRMAHLVVYSVLGLASSVAVAATFVVLRIRCTITASKTIHARMLRSIMRSPMSFFNSTPLGRILGLFSGDQVQIDDSMSLFAGKSIEALVQIIITLALIIIPAPPSLLFLVPLAVIFGRIRAYFIPTMRDTRRMLNRKRNTSTSTTEEALCGADSIRAYGGKRRFELICAQRVEEYMKASWTCYCVNRWLAIRLDMISACVVFCTAVLLVGLQHFYGGISGSQAGLVLTYALSIVGVLNMSIRNMSMLELAFISVERARQYSFLPAKAPEVIEDNKPDKAWPEQGML
ncbi:ATP-binding cassette glutathione S-conjugate transporter ycf1, partial [Coemansia erecta]